MDLHIPFTEDADRMKSWIFWLNTISIMLTLLGAILLITRTVIENKRNQVLDDAKEPRVVPLKVRNEVIQFLTSFQGKPITFEPIGGSEEAQRFQYDLMEVFAKAGWKVSKATMVVGGGVPFPKEVIVYRNNNEFFNESEAVVKVMKRLNYKVQERILPFGSEGPLPNGTLRVVLGEH